MNDTTQPKSLGEALPLEITRVRDNVLPIYAEIGPAGIFAVTLMRQALDRASRAMIEGDLIEMIAAYEDLKGFKL